MKSKIFIFLFLLSPFLLYALYEDKLVDNFERGSPPNLVGGNYRIEGKGIRYWYSRAFARKGNYSLVISLNISKGERGKLVCDLNGLDVSKAKGLSIYSLFSGRKGGLYITLRDREGKSDSVKVPLKKGKWEIIEISRNKFPDVDFNLLDALVFEFSSGTWGKFFVEEIKFFGPSHVFFLSLKDNLFGFPRRKQKVIDPDSTDRKLLERIARDTFQHFRYLVDRRTFLPVDWIDLSPRYENCIGDYTSPTNVGLYLMVMVMADKMGLMGKKEAERRINGVLDTLEKLPRWKGFWYNWYSITNLQVTSPYISTVDNGWLAAGLIVLREAYPKKFGEIVSKWLKEMNFSNLYDPVEGQLYLGYSVDKGKYSPYHYGLLATESRVTSLIAIGKGDIPLEHWFRIYRTLPRAWKWQRQRPQGVLVDYLGVDVFEGYYKYKGIKVVPSWGGSSFEFLMPALVVKEKKLAKRGLGKNDLNILKAQIIYAREKGYPIWGFSPSALPGKEGYGEFGMPYIGSKGYPEKGIISPYASILGIEFMPEEVIKNIRNMLKYFPSLYGEYGFYDSIDVRKEVASTRYLTLDQSMIFLSLANYLTGGQLRKWFHKDPIVEKVEKLLMIEEFYPKARKEKPKEKFIICDFNNEERKNILGGEFGAWDLHPEDPTQMAIDSLVISPRIGKKGYSLQLFYDVNSSQTAANGFWMDMKNISVKDYKYLGFWIKGDKKRGFTRVMKVEVVNEKGEKGYYFVSQIDKEWKEILIPLNKLMGISNLKKIKRLIFTFEDKLVTCKEGVIYLENIFLAK